VSLKDRFAWHYGRTYWVVGGTVESDWYISLHCGWWHLSFHGGRALTRGTTKII
jgi:hypothetical protein